MLGSEVSSTTRVAQCTCATLWCLLSAGIIFGFAALKPILVAEGVYEHVCKVHTAEVTSSGAQCAEQDLKLNMLFTVGASLTNIALIVIGRVLDTYGPRTCGFVGAACLFVGTFVFMFSEQLVLWMDPYIVGYAMLAVGGPFCYMSALHLSNTFPKRSGTILLILTGAFDSSSAVFLGYKYLYVHHGLLLPHFFTLYLAVPVFITVCQLFLMPYELYESPRFRSRSVGSASGTAAAAEAVALALTPLLDDVHTELDHAVHPEHAPLQRRDSIGEALCQPYLADSDDTESVDHMPPLRALFGVLHGYSAYFQMHTWWYGVVLAFNCIQMLRMNYFVTTIHSQYAYMLGDKAATRITNFFDVALPLGGVVAVPFIGYLLDHTLSFVSFSVLLGISILAGVLGLVPKIAAAFANVGLFVVLRPLFYTAILDICAKVFGFETFGQVYGSIYFILGIFNYLQKVLDLLTHYTFHLNPDPVNIALVVLTIILAGFLLRHIYAQQVVYAKKRHSSVGGFN